MGQLGSGCKWLHAGAKHLAWLAQVVEGLGSTISWACRTGTDQMPLSAIYPPALGASVGQIMIWMKTKADVSQLWMFATRTAQGLPTAEAALKFAQKKAEQYSWNDSDPGWPNIEGDLCAAPDRREVKAALRRKKAIKDMCKRPLEINSGSESEKVRRTTTSPAPSYWSTAWDFSH